MARQQHFPNTIKGLSGSIRAKACEDFIPGSIACVTGVRGNMPVVSLADVRWAKRCTGLLFVCNRNCKIGTNSDFLTHLIVPLADAGKAKAGDPVFLTASGKWGLKKTKAALQIGLVVSGNGDELHALLAPQGRY